jgi:hypothetical protein
VFTSTTSPRVHFVQLKRRRCIDGEERVGEKWNYRTFTNLMTMQISFSFGREEAPFNLSLSLQMYRAHFLGGRSSSSFCLCSSQSFTQLPSRCVSIFGWVTGCGSSLLSWRLCTQTRHVIRSARCISLRILFNPLQVDGRVLDPLGISTRVATVLLMNRNC